jgi:hypothetical protein
MVIISLGFFKMTGVSCVDVRLSGSQEPSVIVVSIVGGLAAP